MADDTSSRLTRRDVLFALAPAGAVLLVGGTAARAQGNLPHLQESDPLAKSLGYVDDAKRVDPKANPMYKPGSHCGNCAQLQGKVGDTWRPCTIFAGKLVNVNGWCKVWAAKPS